MDHIDQELTSLTSKMHPRHFSTEPSLHCESSDNHLQFSLLTHPFSCHTRCRTHIGHEGELVHAEWARRFAVHDHAVRVDEFRNLPPQTFTFVRVGQKCMRFRRLRVSPRRALRALTKSEVPCSSSCAYTLFFLENCVTPLPPFSFSICKEPKLGQSPAYTMATG